MVCPVCHSQMIKSRALSKGTFPSSIRCVQCNFVIYYKGLKAAA